VNPIQESQNCVAGVVD